MYFIFLETRIISLHFATYSINLSSLKFFWWAEQNFSVLQEWRFSRSRSSYVTDVDTNLG